MKLGIVVFLLLTSFNFFNCSSSHSNNTSQSNQSTNIIPPDKMAEDTSVTLDTATLGAGCFWCVEAIFQNLKGVYTVESGYSGGTVENPSYELVCTGTTGHAEVARITFDPKVIPYETLLNVFFRTHDPTTLNKQGADVGEQYRSVIFYNSDEQKETAEKVKKEVEDAKVWDDPIVTVIEPLTNFYKAEDYHQDYYNNNPNKGYCSAVIYPKLKKFYKEFPDLLKEKKEESH
ncbi:MAG: peptide-methionine (S)-S-oxide reductase MsrA [Ignavibacteriae bacterium]|nr:peptide-methionine (S)-S-oxide reductase MsrA [Ignavibacteriota bacterium]MCB9244601.1 peptide-methionine (S)-S-oxide reductase MsrA [Ignavibacteriales bacterium]